MKHNPVKSTKFVVAVAWLVAVAVASTMIMIGAIIWVLRQLPLTVNVSFACAAVLGLTLAAARAVREES